MVERAVYRSDAERITKISFDPFHSPYEQRVSPIKEDQPPAEPETKNSTHLLNKSLKEAVWQLKVDLLEKALKKAKYNQKTAAALLGLTYHQFRGLYRQYQARLK
ncbi:MAG: helix-turn-helix domain-containing protein [Planctomycetota bacterium]